MGRTPIGDGPSYYKPGGHQSLTITRNIYLSKLLLEIERERLMLYSDLNPYVFDDKQ